MINNKIKIPWYRRSLDPIQNLDFQNFSNFPELDFPYPKPRPKPRLQPEPIRQPVRVPVPNPVTNPVTNPITDTASKPVFDPGFSPRLYPLPKKDDNPYRKPLPQLQPLRQPIPLYNKEVENSPIWIESVMEKLKESEIITDSEFLINYLKNYDYENFKVPNMMKDLTPELGINIALLVSTLVLTSLISKNVITAPARIFTLTPINPNDVINKNKEGT